MKRIVFILFVFTLLFILSGCKNKTKVLVYDANGNVVQELDSEDDKITVFPEKEGYTFHGFTRSVDETTGNIILTPQYKINTYSVVFLDGDYRAMVTSSVEYGAKVTIPLVTPTLEGYEFKGWDFDFDTIIKDNTSISPIFEKKEFTVKFYLDGVLLKEEKVPYGGCAEAPDVSNVDHYVFEMWDMTFCYVESDLDVTAIGYKYLDYGFYDKYNNFITKLRIATSVCDPTSYPEAPVVPYHTFKEWVEVDSTNSEYDKVMVASYTKDTTTLDKNNSAYWIRQNADIYDVRKVMYSLDEIKKINEDVIVGAYAKTLVVDVKKIEEVKSGSAIKSLIEGYTNITKYTVYNENGTTNNDTTSILNNRNLSGISTNVNVKFGVVTDFCNLRSYPTNCYSKDKEKDQFQETSLNVGEGVAIYHTSLDGKWYFVQAANYNGWVEVSAIALCSKEEMVSFLNASDIVVVIANYVTINNHHVRMGQAFPLEKIEDEKYVIKFPVRKSDGTLEYTSYKVSDNSDYNLGYLPYTLENILIQGFKIYGMSYSWGDKYTTGRDCSSTQNAILACFGFSMPRNTSNQRSIPTYSKSLSSLSATYLKNNYRPGTLIFSSGHVMLYIGTDESGNPYILHNTTGNFNRCVVQNFNEYTNTIIASLSFYNK